MEHYVERGYLNIWDQHWHETENVEPTESLFRNSNYLT